MHYVARTVYLTPELETMLMDQVGRVKALSKRLGTVITWLFTNPRKGRNRSAVAGFQESLDDSL